MDLPKYLDLLRTAQLHLAPLSSMEDAWEGAVGSASRIEELQRLSAAGVPVAQATMMLELAERQSDSDRGRAYVNCWHLSETESAAMWSLYGDRAGIAVRTTWRHLLDAVVRPDELYAIPVEYRDQSAPVTDYSPHAVYTSKRSSYAHEREVRLVRYDAVDPQRAMTAEELQRQPPQSERQPGVSYDSIIDPALRPASYRYDVELRVLVDQVVLAPHTPEWVADVIRDVTARYCVSITVSRSTLEESPSYLRYQFEVRG